VPRRSSFISLNHEALAIAILFSLLLLASNNNNAMKIKRKNYKKPTHMGLERNFNSQEIISLQFPSFLLPLHV